MSAEKTTLEVIAPTVDEAIQKGLNELNLSEEAVEVEVLDPGTRGLFGLGSRQARVRLTVRTEPEKVIESSVRQTSVLFEESQTVSEDGGDGIPQDDILSTARQTVMELLEKMKIKAQVTATIKPAEDKDDEDTVLVNIEGDDLSILIGRRAETLSALQYITSLIVGKRLNRWVPLMIDVQGYRARRERQLRVLARRMAEQAIHTGRRQVLEPMPANERRVIHLELRDHPHVATESIGEDPNRKVTIFLKK